MWRNAITKSFSWVKKFRHFEWTLHSGRKKKLYIPVALPTMTLSFLEGRWADGKKSDMENGKSHVDLRHGKIMSSL